MSNSLRDTGWFKSSRSAGANDACVECRITADHGVGVRDSKNPAGGTLWVGSAAWSGFLAGVKNR
ncbi:MULTISPECIES: DUF397 domain-containing protein [Saccharothrix]|uniref:DUF397 domain-containing protein n=1 Tax=Saccharothrix TaxID=2071 RepID=UPI00093CC91A|nr:DUF397 domain-containing protein [Saccharothrix sp. CB00851]OKI39032.1 hypothetical protein A6A25_02250 [Saccharothrix sp. CB00851]